MPPPRSTSPNALTAWCVLPLSGLALAACAHVSPGKNEPTSIKEESMTTANATLSGDEVSRRVLKLIEGLKSSDQLTPEYVEQQTGLSIQRAASRPDAFGTGAQLTPDWAYNLYVSKTPGDDKNKLIFDFSRTGEGHAPMTAICGMDYKQYAEALKGMGFEDSVSYGEHGRVDHYRFQRPTLSLEVYIEGESDETPEKVRHHCVKMITVE
ncbi:hypothetical protein LVB77_04900 [Lysobacter sp. 5GHs7-4]|uniref:hypothetical protein n=1 Tax=Lysobacter sp. 5GHs7-4 TaxID=2904253 RepID=UPI001E6259E0|nr:hypothetical protein [Lysobacter sp. 5GHs7-4]UHQ24054.1 hypothetical protein LVB77_04900 [Lysobacter sp. 5GHs7-4]